MPNVTSRLRWSVEDIDLRERLAAAFEREGYSPLACANAATSGIPEIVVLGADRPDLLAAIQRVRVAQPEAIVLVLPSAAREDDAVETIRAAAGGAGHLRPRASAAPALLGDSSLMQRARQDILSVARSECNVLITGETGSGKELAARLIHDNSPRSQAAFMSLNCAALPDALIESELFGYEKGSFTGASAAYPGKLKVADGGTVFLDEVGDMSLFAQAKLLRAVEDRSVFRLGGRAPVTLDFRLVSATNQDLHERARAGLFRFDLYYRLKVAHIALPPLRDRRDDIPLLARHYASALAAASVGPAPEFSADAIACLCEHDWPGNVRELRNAVESALVRAGSAGRIERRHLPAEFLMAGPETGAALTEPERIRAALEATHGNKSAAAQRLRWSRMTLYRKLAKHSSHHA